MRVVVLLILTLCLVAPAVRCSAQGEDAYPAPAADVPPAPSYSSSAAVMDGTLPPPTVQAEKRGRWWGRLVPSDRAIWLISNIADITQFSYQETDTLTTAHIKSGKGMREARLAVKMLVGAAATGSLAGELLQGRKHVKKHKWGRGSAARHDQPK